MRRWSKLKKKVEGLWTPDLDMAVHCNSYRHEAHTLYNMERHWIVLNGVIIWDFPGPFLKSKNPDHPNPVQYHPSMSFPTPPAKLFDEYLSCPVDELLTRKFEEDHYGLGDIMRAADRRLGKTRLFAWRLNMPPGPSPAIEVLKARFPKREKVAA